MSTPEDDAPLPAGENETLTTLLSLSRLNRFLKLGASEAEAVSLHQASLRIGCQLLIPVATIEISLRNAVHDNMSTYFGVENWLSQTPIKLEWKDVERKRIQKAMDDARRAEYAKLSQRQKADLELRAYPRGRPAGTSHQKRAKDRRQQISVPEGKVVAELTMFFWKRLFGPEYDQRLWQTTLKRVFPTKTVSRAEVAKNLEVIYQARNRLAHHEPVHDSRFNHTCAAVRFVAQNLLWDTTRGASDLFTLIEPDLVIAERMEAEFAAALSGLPGVKPNP